jgi:P4 family phage/plasmid primase-like protien
MNIDELNEKVNGGFDEQIENAPQEIQTLESIMDDGETAKEGGPTLEYIYISRVDKHKKSIIDEYRKADGNIYFWTGEYWMKKEEDLIKEEINKWLKETRRSKLSSKNISSIYNIFCINVKSFENLNFSELIIPTKNHWLKIDDKTGVITAIKPLKRIAIRYQVNVIINFHGEYTPKDMPEKSLFSKFIKSSLIEESPRNLVQEYCGLTLTNTNRKQKAQAWVGNGANGKSQLIEMLQAVHQQSISVKLSNIGIYNDRLIGASLIFATEMDKGSFDQEFFKGAVSGDCVEIRGIYGSPLQAVLLAKWILIGNNLPAITDYSNGVFRRLQIINWTASFEESKNKVEDLAKTVIRDELDIFLDWCLSGLQSLIKADWNFTKSDESDVALNDYKLNQDKIKLFFTEMGMQYSEDQTCYTTKESLFDNYDSWSRTNNFSVVSSTTFWSRARNIFPQMAKDSQDTKKNGKRICFLHVPFEGTRPKNTGVQHAEPKPIKYVENHQQKINELAKPKEEKAPPPSKKLQGFGLSKAK